MVNTRSEFKKSQNTTKICLPEVAIGDSDHLSTPSGALIGSNDDLLTEILRRLPVKSVLRFKSVSKHWQSLLSHQRFILLYKSVLSSPGFFLGNLYIPFDDEDRSHPPFRDFDFYSDPCGIKIVQSCNGLLLCCSERVETRADARKYYVFNPTTKQFAIIPSVCGGKNVRKHIRFMGLAFHQTSCVHYKLLCIHHGGPNTHTLHMQIYSSETGKWKISDQSFSSPPFLTHFSSPVYWNGAIYWASSSSNPPYFKLDVEKLQTMPLPLTLPPYAISWDLYFGESGGHLHIVQTVPPDSRLRLNVCEMLSDHSGWFLKYEVDLHELSVVYPELIGKLPSVFDVVRGENEEEAFMVIVFAQRVIKFNLVDKTFKLIYNLSSPHCMNPHLDVPRYIPNLASC